MCVSKINNLFISGLVSGTGVVLKEDHPLICPGPVRAQEDWPGALGGWGSLGLLRCQSLSRFCTRGANDLREFQRLWEAPLLL